MENSNRENTHLLGYIFSLNSVMKTLSVKNNFFPDEGRKLEKSVWRLQKKQAGENSLKKKKKRAWGRFVNGHNSTYLWMYRKTQCT